MDNTYLVLSLTLLGGIVAIIKDWKEKGIEGALKSNIIGIISFAAVVTGSIIAFQTSREAIKEKKKSDDTSNARQNKIVKLLDQSNHSLKSQLDTTVTILNYSKQLNDAQSSFSRLQKEDSHLQAQLYSEVIGGNRIDKSFVFNIIVDERDFSPTPVHYNDWMKSIALSIYGELNFPMTAVVNGARSSIPIVHPKNSDECAKYLAQMVQYKVISDMIEIEHSGFYTNSVSVNSERNTTTVSNRTSDFDLKKKFILSNVDTIRWSEIVKSFSNRGFAKSDYVINRWRYSCLDLPKGTHLSLDSSVGKNASSIKYKIRLVNKRFFNIEISIEPYGSSNPIDGNAGVPSEIAPYCRNYFYMVKMLGSFYNLKAGIPETAEYKKWADWIFESLKAQNYAK